MTRHHVSHRPYGPDVVDVMGIDAVVGIHAEEWNTITHYIDLSESCEWRVIRTSVRQQVPGGMPSRMPFGVSLSRPVFTLYTGLTASGYDLAAKYAPPDGMLSALIQDIRAKAWPEDALAYFRKARLLCQGVNPYWPRAAMLLKAAFHLDRNGPGEPAKYENETEVLESVYRFPTEPENRAEDTVEWVRQYPWFHGLIEDSPGLETLWRRFSAWMGPEELEPFRAAAQGAVAWLQTGLGVAPEDIPAFTVIPNPLQAPQIADFVRKDGRLYAVLAKARPQSIAHEVLHTVFEKAITGQRAGILARRSDLFTKPVAEAMVRMQYAWDDGPESWLRVFEETLVRAATLWIAHRDAPDEGDRLALEESRDGFIYVPAMLRAFREDWTGPGQIEHFIRNGLYRMAQEKS